MKIKLVMLALGLFSLIGCEEEVYSPKPFGYSRIDYGDHVFKKVAQPGCPFTLNIGAIANVAVSDKSNENMCWFNVEYPTLKAKIHFSYFEVNKDVGMYIGDGKMIHASVSQKKVRTSNFNKQYWQSKLKGVGGFL